MRVLRQGLSAGSESRPSSSVVRGCSPPVWFLRPAPIAGVQGSTATPQWVAEALADGLEGAVELDGPWAFDGLGRRRHSPARQSPARLR